MKIHKIKDYDNEGWLAYLKPSKSVGRGKNRHFEKSEVVWVRCV